MVPADDARHRAKMAKRKEVQDREVASKTVEKGLLIVHTGPGKGKSTAAFGLMLRALGHGLHGRRRPVHQGRLGDRRAHWRWSASPTRSSGTPWAKASPGRRRTARATSPPRERAWEKAKELMARPDIRLVVLDELNIALRYDYLPLGEVVATLRQRRPDLHVVVTGRNAKPELIEAADLVTEMTLVKHHFAPA